MKRTPQTMLVNKDLVNAIRSTLRGRGTAGQDVEDRVADVQVKVLEFLKVHPAPEGIEDWKKLCTKIAKELAIDEHRKKKRRALYDVELCEEPDAYSNEAHVERSFDPVDEARLMEVLVTELCATSDPDVSFTILDAEAAGTPHTELAAELGMTRWGVQRRLSTMQRSFEERVEARGLRELTPRVRPKGG